LACQSLWMRLAEALPTTTGVAISDRRASVCSRQRTTSRRSKPRLPHTSPLLLPQSPFFDPRSNQQKVALGSLAFWRRRKLFNITAKVPVCLSYVASAVARSSKTPDSISTSPSEGLRRSDCCIEKVYPTKQVACSPLVAQNHAVLVANDFANWNDRTRKEIKPCMDSGKAAHFPNIEASRLRALKDCLSHSWRKTLNPPRVVRLTRIFETVV
jgi:hypothetical protein